MSEALRLGRYARFVSAAAAIVLVLLAVGFLPTRRLAGDGSIAAMVAGGLMGFVAAGAAGLLILLLPAATPTDRMKRASLAMAARLAVAAGLGIAAALSGEFSRAPLLFWLATTYVVLLPLEVRLAIAPE